MSAPTMSAGVTPGRSPLAGRREAGLLGLPSVRRMTEVLLDRCREPSWVRLLVPALDRFRAFAAVDDLEGLLQDAREDDGVATDAMARLAGALRGRPASAVAGLAMGPKVWFRLNGVPVAWRPLAGRANDPPLPAAIDGSERLVHLALIGSGLRLAELLRARVGDLGALDEAGRVVPDLRAEPLALRYEQRQGRVADRITFLTFEARAALHADLARRRTRGLDGGADAPLVVRPDGRPASRGSVTRARRRANDLIRAGNRLNVELCRTTGDFFREWGMPGSRFVPHPPPDEGGSA